MPSPVTKTTTAEDTLPLLPLTECPDERCHIHEECTSDTYLKERNRALYRGVALVVKQWPDHVSSGWLPFIYLAFFIVAFSFIFLSAILVQSKLRVYVDLHFKIGRYDLHSNETLLDFVISCEGEATSSARFPQQPLSRSRFQTPFSVTDRKLNNSLDGINPLERMFFISTEEGATSERLCSIESAVSSLSNTTVYFILLHNEIPQPSHLTLFVERLKNLYNNLSVHRIGIRRYFSGSPLSEILENSSPSKFLSPDMLELAARALTIWRYGGVSVYPELAVRNGSLFPGRGNVTKDEVVLSKSGSVISSGYQCHELLFQIMSTLTKFANNSENSYNTSEQVISSAVRNFCANETFPIFGGINNGSDKFSICPGVSLLSSELMCESGDNRDNCLWKPINGMLSQEREKLCPLASDMSLIQ